LLALQDGQGGYAQNGALFDGPALENGAYQGTIMQESKRIRFHRSKNRAIGSYGSGPVRLRRLPFQSTRRAGLKPSCSSATDIAHYWNGMHESHSILMLPHMSRTLRRLSNEVRCPQRDIARRSFLLLSRCLA